MPNWLPEASGAVLGATWAAGSFPGGPQNSPAAPRGRKKNIAIFRGPSGDISQRDFTLQGGSRGTLWPPFWEPLGLILAFLLATDVETAKISQRNNQFVYFLIFAGQFYAIFGTLLPALLRARPPREHGQI